MGMAYFRTQWIATVSLTFGKRNRPRLRYENRTVKNRKCSDHSEERDGRRRKSVENYCETIQPWIENYRKTDKPTLCGRSSVSTKCKFFFIGEKPFPENTIASFIGRSYRLHGVCMCEIRMSTSLRNIPFFSDTIVQIDKWNFFRFFQTCST